MREADANRDAQTFRARVRHLPSLVTEPLPPAQIGAVTGVEDSLAQDRHSRALVQMATGAG
jgi:type I restriction enzyme R subunit